MFDPTDATGLKKGLIDTFDLVEANFLHAFKGIQPITLLRKTARNVNNIFYIITHCAFHMDGLVKSVDGVRMLNTALVPFLKRESEDPYISFTELIDDYLKLSARFREILESTPAEKYLENIPDNAREPWYKAVQRIFTHFMGHTGQISTLKRLLEDEAQYFMQGVDHESRTILQSEFKEWWEENRENYSEIK